MLLLAAVIAAAAPLTVFATEESGDQGMETALVAVKSLVDIDDEIFTEFSYSSSFSNHETREGLTWTFSWSDNISGYIYATATADGTLLQFNKFDRSHQSFGFAQIERSDAAVIASEFIEKANPATCSYYGAPSGATTGLNNNAYSLTYYAEVNGYAFDAAAITVNVDKFTGEVLGYNTRNVDPQRYRFDSATDIIDQSAAVAAYAEKIGLSLEYKGYFENGRITVFPAYLFNSHGDRFISAISGEVVGYVYDLGSGSTNASGTAGAPMAEEQEADSVSDDGGSSRVNITPAERAAIEQASGFMTSEQALERLLEAADLVDLDLSTFNEQHISLDRDYINSARFFYDVNMFRHDSESEDDIAGFFGRIEASTGRVLAFHLYYSGTPYGGEHDMTEEQVEAAVSAFLERMDAEELEKSELISRSSPSVDRYGNTRGNYSYNYVRYENDIPFRDNGINLIFNQFAGRVTSYSLNWYDDATFPDISGAMAPQQALAAYAALAGSKMKYITVGDGNAALVYDFGGGGYIDPFTGNALGRTGEPLTNMSETPAYRDIIGHWSERYVMRLLENGVYLWGDPFDPERQMTELEFLHYIMLIEGYTPSTRDVQSYYFVRGIEVEASEDRLLTRQEAARIIVEYLGFGALAHQPESYVYPFGDYVDDAYKCYITICYIMGIVGGDNGGGFAPLENITRAEAATLLHNLILAKS